jgi:hypothetical protein
MHRKENIFIAFHLLRDRLEGTTEVSRCQWAKFNDEIARKQFL